VCIKLYPNKQQNILNFINKTQHGIIMVKCPNCKKENPKPAKTWKYGQFTVQAYTCNNCKTQYREYTKNGKHSFTLKLQKGKGYIKT